MSYQQLAEGKRYQIAALIAQGLRPSEVARIINVHRSDQGWLHQRKQLTQVALCRYHAGNRALDASGAELEPDAIANGDSLR